MEESTYPSKKRLAILGSTGSIGTQTLDIIRMHPELFVVEVLMAQSNWRLLVSQAREFRPRAVVIGNKAAYPEVRDALQPLDIQVFAGEESTWQILDSGSIDMVLLAVVGAAGLRPAITALENGIDLALANKESLVAGGGLVMKAALSGKAIIIPVDSEHSAVFQCLNGERTSEVKRIILTASGGPFHGKDLDFLCKVTPEQAIRHPNWTMGCKISVDSATLMNKGLEVIEAHWLFGLPAERIDVLIHPQSVVHSMVEFVDGSMKAQLGPADMRLPILYALAWPRRIAHDSPTFDLTSYPCLVFEQPDTRAFRNLTLAYEALKQAGNMPCILNAANEVAVRAFLKKELAFLEIPVLVEQVMKSVVHIAEPGLEEIIKSDDEARLVAGEIIKARSI